MRRESGIRDPSTNERFRFLFLPPPSFSFLISLLLFSRLCCKRFPEGMGIIRIREQKSLPWIIIGCNKTGRGERGGLVSSNRIWFSTRWKLNPSSFYFSFRSQLCLNSSSSCFLKPCFFAPFLMDMKLNEYVPDEYVKKRILHSLSLSLDFLLHQFSQKERRINRHFRANSSSNYPDNSPTEFLWNTTSHPLIN